MGLIKNKNGIQFDASYITHTDVRIVVSAVGRACGLLAYLRKDASFLVYATIPTMPHGIGTAHRNR